MHRHLTLVTARHVPQPRPAKVIALETRRTGAPRDEAPDTAAASRGRVMNDGPPAKEDGRRLIVRM